MELSLSVLDQSPIITPVKVLLSSFLPAEKPFAIIVPLFSLRIKSFPFHLFNVPEG